MKKKILEQTATQVGKKILVAEDDKFLANAYRVKLTKAGFAVTMVHDGEQVIKELRSSIPNLIILDLVMPIKDGFTTLSEVKKNTKWKNIPVIIATNLSQNEDIEKCMKLGANAFVVKTDLSLKELLRTINETMQ